MLEVERLEVAYGEARALDGVSLEVGPASSSAWSARTVPARAR